MRLLLLVHTINGIQTESNNQKLCNCEGMPHISKHNTSACSPRVVIRGYQRQGKPTLDFDIASVRLTGESILQYGPYGCSPIGKLYVEFIID